MEDKNFLKITYHSEVNQINFYLKSPSQFYNTLRRDIARCLSKDHKQQRCEIRTYWIDDNEDEIEMVNQSDYDIFMDKNSKRQHLQVVPISIEKTEEQLNVDATNTAIKTPKTCSQSSSASQQAHGPQAATGSYNFATHTTVRCDACFMKPIIGFRYKCIQCRNYDLCQNCESKHMHSEHMMVRMPTNNCSNGILANRTGPTARKQDENQSGTVIVSNLIREFLQISMETNKQSKVSDAADVYGYGVHKRIICDACLAQPIIGFRYKCIQCPNYDLCQNCESEHIHSEHTMARMPIKKE